MHGWLADLPLVVATSRIRRREYKRLKRSLFWLGRRNVEPKFQKRVLRQIPQSRGQQLLGGTPCAFNPAEVRIACFLVHLIDQASKCISARHVIPARIDKQTAEDI
jgi:hypothetical protein